MHAILWITQTGAQWRNLNSKFPAVHRRGGSGDCPNSTRKPYRPKGGPFSSGGLLGFDQVDFHGLISGVDDRMRLGLAPERSACLQVNVLRLSVFGGESDVCFGQQNGKVRDMAMFSRTTYIFARVADVLGYFQSVVFENDLSLVCGEICVLGQATH